MNYKLCQDIGTFDRKSYNLYLRSESIKKLINPSYKMDKSINSFKLSKFYGIRNISYSEYLADMIDKSISYTDYVSESIDKSISYTKYLAEQCTLSTSSNIEYSEIFNEKI